MNSYKEFSEVYDSLMKKDFDYEKIADFLENIFSEYDISPDLVCELASGTGNITIPMAKRGYDMIGIDNSADMLSVAKEKSRGISNLLFLNQNMTKLDLYGTVDVFYSLIDGVNYVLTPNSLFEMFKKIKKCFLNPGGLLIFDISTEYKLKKVIGDNTFVYNAPELFYVWENRFINSKKISDMYLTFFKKCENGGYKRFSERHLQRAYTVDELKKMLQKAGFGQIDLYDGTSLNPIREDSERIVFVAK